MIYQGKHFHTEYTGFHQGTLVIHRCTPVKKVVHRVPYSAAFQTVSNVVIRKIII